MGQIREERYQTSKEQGGNMNVSAIIKLEVEVQTTGAWDNKCSIEQIYKQVGDEAYGKVRSALNDHPNITISGKPQMRIMYTKD